MGRQDPRQIPSSELGFQECVCPFSNAGDRRYQSLPGHRLILVRPRTLYKTPAGGVVTAEAAACIAQFSTYLGGPNARARHRGTEGKKVVVQESDGRERNREYNDTVVQNDKPGPDKKRQQVDRLSDGPGTVSPADGPLSCVVGWQQSWAG